MTLYEFDARYRKGSSFLCGVDEVGRGPLAGSVYAAAVILPPGLELDGLNDSKKLSEKKRELIYSQIISNAISYCVAWASVEEIESLNIRSAALLAMRRAVEGLSFIPDYTLVDGNALPNGLENAEAIIGGDAKSAVIAAASVLAKVERDALMCKMDDVYPGYYFTKHKGYPTKLHYDALDVLGPSPIHRRVFLRKWVKSHEH